MATKKKALTQADIKAKAERWAMLTKKIETLETAKDAELAPIVARHEKQLAPVHARHDALIDPLQAKADEMEIEINEWLGTQKKSIRIETRNAVAEFSKGTKFGGRVVNAFKFVETATERKIKDLWKYVSVTIKDAETVLGKADLETICEKPKVPSEIASLTLKD